MAYIRLDDSFSIKTDKTNFILIEKTKGYKNIAGERIETVSKKKRYYGTLYQALACYLFYSVDKAGSVKEMRKIAISVMNTIDSFQEEIKKQFGTNEYRLGPDIIKGDK